MGWTRTSAAATLLLAMEQHRKQAGQRVRALREARGWGQEDLSHRADLSVKTISRFENGRHDGRRGTVRAIAEALEVTELDILGPPPDVLGLKSVATDDQLNGVSSEFSVRVDNVEAQLSSIEEKLDRLLRMVDEGLFTPRADGESRDGQIGLGAALAQAFQDPELLAELRAQLQPPAKPSRTGHARDSRQGAS